MTIQRAKEWEKRLTGQFGIREREPKVSLRESGSWTAKNVGYDRLFIIIHVQRDKCGFRIVNSKSCGG
jgi:hypothetical protein